MSGRKHGFLPVRSRPEVFFQLFFIMQKPCKNGFFKVLQIQYTFSMYSDTHFHFQHFTENPKIDGAAVLCALAERSCFFGLDIGTHSDDLFERQSCADSAIARIKNTNLADKARAFLYFSAGIWPAAEEIATREKSVQTLRAHIDAAASSDDADTLHRSIIAIGECGLDHHWNPNGADGRCESDFDKKMLDGEKELFEMQLALAQKMKLPVIVHSRDAFMDTYNCIKNIGWNSGIIHCYSYGLEEARKFLNLGWYISFSGAVTYTKKSRMIEMQELLAYIPNDRILCETDAPYLAPVPYRGQINTPVLVEHTYKYIAEARKTTPQELSETVDSNIKSLFNLAV